MLRNLLKCLRLFSRDTMLDDITLFVVKFLHRPGNLFLEYNSLLMVGKQLLLATAPVSQRIEHGKSASCFQLRIQGAVASHPLIHLSDFGLLHIQDDRRLLKVVMSEHTLDGALCLVQLEKQLLLGLRSTYLEKAPVGDYEVLHICPDPPDRIGNKPDPLVRVELSDCHHQAYIPLLDKIKHLHAVSPVFRADLDHKSEVGCYQQMSCGKVLFFIKTYRKPLLLFRIKKWKPANLGEIQGEAIGYNRQIHCHCCFTSVHNHQKKLALHLPEC